MRLLQTVLIAAFAVVPACNKDESCDKAIRHAYASCWGTAPTDEKKLEKLRDQVDRAIAECKENKKRYPKCNEKFSEYLNCIASDEFKDGACARCDEYADNFRICIRESMLESPSKDAHLINRKDKATALNDAAVEMMIEGRFDSALKKLDNAIVIDPKNVQANYHRGICLAEKQKWKEAIEAFDRTIQIEPEEANAYFNKGKILWNIGKYKEAMPVFEEAIVYIDNLEKLNIPSLWLLMGECGYEIYVEKFLKGQKVAGEPKGTIYAYKTYLGYRPGAPDRKAVEQKIDILKNPSNYLKILKKRKHRGEKGQMTIDGLKKAIEEEEAKK